MEKKTFYLTCERTWVYDTLIFAAGILGSYTYMLCGGIFCNAQTGNIVLLGIALGTRSWTSALYYVIPISAYALGAFISELIPDDVKHRFHIRWETILVAVEIVFVAVLGALPASTPVQVFQVSINFIASMQYNTFRNSEGVPMATTFATNHVRQLGIGLAKELHRRHGDTSHRRVLKRHFSMVLFFLAGTIPRRGSVHFPWPPGGLGRSAPLRHRFRCLSPRRPHLGKRVAGARSRGTLSSGARFSCFPDHFAL